MSLVADLESKKKKLEEELVFTRNLKNRMKEETDKKCKLLIGVGKKYKKEYAEKKLSVRRQVKEINARIRSAKRDLRSRKRSAVGSKKRKRCPNGTRKNSKTGTCQRM